MVRASEASEERDEPARHTFLQALALTAASVPVPGLAHLRSGHRRLGAAFLAVFAALVAAGVTGAVTLSRQELLRYAVQPRWLVVVMAVAAALALWWFTVVISSYLAVRPPHLSTRRRVVGAVVVTALCLVAAAPLLVAGRYAYVQRDLVNSVFPEKDQRRPQVAGAVPPTKDNPWAGQRRVNVLLLGGDGGYDRYGVRTDSMTLASIDTETGRTVLMSLPRNLQHAPMPAGPMRNRFPDGFDDLLNEVYQYVEDHPEMAPDVTANKGAEVLKATISGILGMPVDYFVLVNLFGFRDLVDALGGVKLRITEPIPYGQQGRVLTPGLRHLNGSQALWYGRSRTDSDDYTRMRRQRCLLGAIARQADPLTVIRRFQQVAGATKRVVSTDIPRGLLPDLVDLAAKAKEAQVTSLQFVPPLIKTYRPDWAFIRTAAREAVAESEAEPSATRGPAGTGEQPSQAASPGAAATTTPGVTTGGSPGATASGTPAPSPSHTSTPTPSGDQTPSPGPTPVSLDNVCQYS